MLWRQTICFLCKYRNFGEISCTNFGRLDFDGAQRRGWPTGFLNLADDRRGIRLESAAQVFHMIHVT